jgi:precorrin-6y C5,15-methyltransferase (decarboxylating) CbiE subunit
MVEKRLRVSIVGCGPGSEEYVTSLAATKVREADTLVGPRRLLDLFPWSAAERIEVGHDVALVLEAVKAHYKDGRRVTVLVTGDPGLASLAQPLLRELGRESCEVTAGVSSVQVAFARLGLPWADAVIINAHGRDAAFDPGALKSSGKVVILAGGARHEKELAAFLEEARSSHRVFVMENLALSNEQVLEYSGPESLHLAHPTIILIIRRDLL